MLRAHRALAVRFHDLGLAVDDQPKGPLERDHREGFERGIQRETADGHTDLHNGADPEV